MKILHFNYSLASGGIETMLVNIANIQVEEGHEIHILVFWDNIDQSLLQRIDPRVIIHRINRPQQSKNLFYYLRANFYILKIMPDIIHVHSAKLIEAIWFPFFRHRMCVTQHRNCNGIGSSKLRYYKHIFAISKSVQQDIFDSFKLKSIVVYNGIKPEQIKSYGVKYSKSDGKFHVVQVGRLFVADKGQDLLLNALKILVDRGIRDICLDLIGDGPSLHALLKLTKELSLCQYVNFLGNKSQAWIFDYLCKYDLLVQPSRFEGFGLTIAEAMTACIPVLVSDNQGPMEIIDNGRFGFYFKSGDVESCANRLFQLYNNRPNWNKLIEARNQILNKFNVKLTAYNYLKQYSCILQDV